jgi:2-oxoglutarate dehydrogenase E2 component (dihydrolipoamide succinyltransferase)
MKIEVKIPSMGESITGGLLSNWHVQSGSVVKEGQVLYDLETDKISSEGTAEKSGKITILVQSGVDVSIGQVVAMIDSDFEEVKHVVNDESKKNHVSEKPLSPAVKKIVEEKNIDVKAIEGTGKDGRITKADVLKNVSEKKVHNLSRVTKVKMTPMRKKIAERLVMAQNEAAMLTTFNEVDMQTIMHLRKKYQDVFLEKHGVKLGFMSFFVKAVVRALRCVPEMNVMIDGDDIIQNNFYDIGVAVGGAKGLVVPVVRDCDSLSLAQIEKAIIDYAKKAKEGKLLIEDLQGGVFTISNGGVYGSVMSTPILNPPQSGILGMHAIKERPVVVDGQIVIRPMMHLALTYDHRVVDGREAVTFLIKVKEFLEMPWVEAIDTLLDI